ncbi:MAG TPA: SiaB family protein kinase, partial [Spirochaetia bacterium]|nr:SiaB family protein kinase [Spirochaetia bacterium]
MASFDLFALRNVFEEHSIMMCFSGPFSHSVIEELGVAIKKYLLSEDAPKDRLADVFAVFVEQAQNLKNYTERSDFDGSTEANYRSGTLAIAREDERYVVSSGNLVRS